MNILVVDTSTKAMLVGLYEDNNSVFEIIRNKTLSHSEILMPSIKMALEESNLSINDVDRFGIVVGPGSFTGIRIGVSTVNSFSMIGNGKVVEISSLLSRALRFKCFEGFLIVNFLAQRDEYYYGIYFSKNSELEIVEEGISKKDFVVDKIKELSTTSKVLVSGEISFEDEEFKESVILEKSYLPSMDILFEFVKNIDENKIVKYASPIYMKKSQAEEEYDKRMLSK